MTHQARKRFGQNFLTDQSVLDRIERCLNPKDDQRFVEIGPGLGALTNLLIHSVKHLTAIEIDKDLINQLQHQFNFSHFNLIDADALKLDFSQFNLPFRLVGNLPYNISTPLLFHILSFNVPIIDMHFMLQKEVIDRMTASPNQKIYGRLSVMTQYFCQATHLFNVAGSSFTPPPKVTSAFVKLVPYQDNSPYEKVDSNLFKEVVRTCFTLRRKTLNNCLKQWLTSDDYIELNIDPKNRPENLSVKEFVSITRYIENKGL